MAIREQLDAFKQLAKEVELLGDRHPAEIRCRLCEVLPLRVAIAAIPLMDFYDLKKLGEYVEESIQRRLSVEHKGAVHDE
jgi:hypothetical protein